MENDDFWLDEPSWEELDAAPVRTRPSMRALAPFLVLFVVFTCGVTYVTLSTAPFQPGMEFRQISLARAYARAPGFFIQDSLQTYSFGAVSAQPALYSLVLGKSLLVEHGSLSTLLYLRLINLPLSVLYFSALCAFILSATSHRGVQLVFLTLMTSLSWPMLSFASVSDHNLDFLMTALVYLSCACFFSSFSITALLSLLLCLLVGALNSAYFLTLLFSVLVVLACYWRRVIQALFSEQLEPRALALAFLTLFFFAANLILYGKNLYSFGTLVPSADQVLGREIAYRYVPSYRNRQDLIIRSTTTPAPSISQHAQDYFATLVEQTLSSRAIGAYRFSQIDYLIFAIGLLPACIGALAAAIRRMKRKKFADEQKAHEPHLLRPILLIWFVYGIIFVVQDLIDYRTLEVVLFDPLDSRVFPLILGGMYLLCHFSLDQVSRRSFRVLVVVLLVATCIVESVPRTVLHVKANPLSPEPLNAR